MLITSKEDLLIATEQLSDNQKEDINLFLHTAEASPSFEALTKSFDDSEFADGKAILKVKGNFGHIIASVTLSLNEDDFVLIDIQCYE